MAMKLLAHSQFLAAVAFATALITTACSLPVISNPSLPRNQNLKAFDPHRQDFTCIYQDSVVPPIDADADAWNRQALALTSPKLWPSDRDYVRAAQLWHAAAERRHWKAMMNLAEAYVNGQGVSRNREHAVLLVEQAMNLGIPEAFYVMGSYHQEGIGVRPDTSRAYAFWELAAHKGSASAMALLGSK